MMTVSGASRCFIKGNGRQSQRSTVCKNILLNLSFLVFLLKKVCWVLLLFLLNRSVTEEEREAKYVRMLTSSLLGVKRLFSLLLQNDRATLEPKLALLVNSGKFWKYSKHKIPQVGWQFHLEFTGTNKKRFTSLHVTTLKLTPNINEAKSLSLGSVCCSQCGKNVWNGDVFNILMRLIMCGMLENKVVLIRQ